MSRAGKKSPDAPSNETRLIEATVRCLEKYGSAKTYIDDIAKEAGLSRQTAWRTFRTRQELFEAVFDQRIAQMVAFVRPRLQHYKTFEEALVRGTIDAIHAARNDSVVQTILETAGYHGLDRILFKRGSKGIKTFELLWHDIFTQARAEGVIRRDLSDDEMFEYMSFVHVFLISKEDMSDKKHRDFLVHFMIPALKAWPESKQSTKAVAPARKSAAGQKRSRAQ